MSEKTHNVIGLLNRIDHALEVADNKRSFETGLIIAKEVMALFGLEEIPAGLKSFPRLKSNPSWTKNAPDYEDRKASYALAENNDRNIDFKLFWVTKPGKRIISNLVALTPNFEDESFYSNKNVGIDFALSENADRLIVVLSNNYKIRVLEIYKRLSNTQKKIFEKWAQVFDFSNKAQTHKILWDSFDIQPLNKEFYIEISSFFNELVQYLEKEGILDKKHRSQFVNRLIGRIIFCWFLRKKEIISENAGYFDSDGKQATEYYSKKLELLFFKVLNTPLEERAVGVDDKTPFLNGGLFEEKESDLAGRGELSFPADYFDRFYSFLNRYNFTTDESTSDFQQVAIDPEMLGRIFENLLAEEIEETGEQARKAKGAFYTPREIVDYMCRESLRAYISEKLGDDTRKDEVLLLLFDKKEHELDPKSILGKLGTYKGRIIEALDGIKIIDPACGSGAFPIGMLQIMLSIYERLDARLDHYKTKLAIIKNNIFGVDIEPMAVEISRLRTWLSLVVDSVINPSEKNKGMEELPNLDFKFICANSLIPLDQAEGLFDNNKMAEQIQAIRERYFKTNSLRIKDKMKRDFDDILKKNQSMFASLKQNQLLTYHPFDADNICSFFDGEFMFGVPKFNIVIANPPYINTNEMKSMNDLYRKIYSTAFGSYDIYVVFFEKAISLLRPNGIVCFITSNKFLIADYAVKLRELLLKKCSLMKLIDLADCKRVFQQALVSPCVTIAKNIEPEGGHVVQVAILKNDDLNFISQAKFVSKELTSLATNEKKVFDIYVSNEKQVVIDSISKGSIELGKIADVRTGVMGFDYWNMEQFIRDGHFSGSIRIVTNGFIDRYVYTWGQKARLYKKDCFNPYFDIDKCSLSDQTKALFRNKKIIIRGVAQKLSANLDDEGYAILVAVHAAVIKEGSQYDRRYVVAILNSSLMNWLHLIKFYTARIPEGSLKYPVSFLKTIPIKDIPLKKQKPIIDLVDQIMKITKSKNYKNTPEEQSAILSIKNKIDEMVVELYGLSPEEVALINRSFE